MADKSFRKYNIALIPGDGIGHEISGAAVDVLKAVSEIYGFEISVTEYPAGGAAIDLYGVPLPDSTLEGARKADAVLLGAVGGPKWDSVAPELRPERALLGLRSGLGLYSNLRPAVMFEELSSACPIKNVDAIDIMIVRELTGGIYFGENDSYKCNELLEDGTPKGTVAYDTETYSEGEIVRIVKQAFKLAQQRNKHLTLVDKANVLRTSRLWRQIATSMSADYPDVKLDFLYVDNCSMQLISRPESFDTIVTSNMFGDILSDEAGQITGSVGMLPSASLGAPGKPGMFEPVHGSAPDIAGRGIANPLAMILSAAMLLRWGLAEYEAADCIEHAVRRTLAQGFRTQDIAYGAKEGAKDGAKEGADGADGIRIVGTDEMASNVISNIK